MKTYNEKLYFIFMGSLFFVSAISVSAYLLLGVVLLIIFFNVSVFCWSSPKANRVFKIYVQAFSVTLAVVALVYFSKRWFFSGS